MTTVLAHAQGMTAGDGIALAGLSLSVAIGWAAWCFRRWR